jgi:predicted phosphodiesterase
MIQVACVSDVHAPKNFEVFKEALKKLEEKEIDLFLFGGDMIYKGKIDEIQKILALLENMNIKFPIYA